MTQEIWDAYDEDGNKLGFDLVRGDPLPDGIYHIVVEIYTVTNHNEILVTRRAQKKLWPLRWEVTAGAIVKGETAEQGAIRELKEETGIDVTESDLNLVFRYVYESEIYHCFVVFIDKDKTEIQLQEGETTAYRYLSYFEFKQFVRTDEFAPLEGQQFCAHEKLFDAMILERENQPRQ